MEEANSSVLGPLTDDNIRKDLKRRIGFADQKIQLKMKKLEKFFID